MIRRHINGVCMLPSGTVSNLTDAEITVIFDRAKELGLFSDVDAGMGAYTVTDWSNGWSFSVDGSTFSAVALPHTCNTADGQSASMYRGKTYYQKSLTAVANKTYYLLVEAAGQKSQTYIDDVLISEYKGGYTPFVVKLSGLAQGEHSVKIICDNTADVDLIPVSADFNFNNGLHRKMYLLTQAEIGFDAEAFGQDRVHITQTNVTNESATICVDAAVNSNAETTGTITFELFSGDSSAITDSADVVLSADGYSYSKTFVVPSPHLWDGRNDPFLYTAKLTLTAGAKTIDTVQTKVGLRYFSLDADKGFLLNGKEYPLRGASLHQDYPGKMSAMTAPDFDADYATVMEMGCTCVRLAHYPHSQYAFDTCDELGLIVQTEIPWVNHCGANATDAYFACIKDNLTSMITHYYNHPSIVFWGLSNELNGTHWKSGSSYTDPQGGYDYSKALAWNNELYAYAKTLEPSRLIGLTIHDQTFDYSSAKSKEWSADWIGSNQYKGWYGSAAFTAFGSGMDSYRAQRPYWAVTEYGAGANPEHHSDTPETTTNKGSGGARHDEEYANLFHESYLAQIQARPWIVFTTFWALFDFAVAGRNEGGTPYTNDKGLITRDRQIKKDAFYLYKAAWSNDPVIYITSRRFTNRETSTITIKAYANTDTVSLYRGNDLLQTLTTPTKCGCVWEFTAVPFAANSETFRIVGEKSGVTVSDQVTFATSNLPTEPVTITYVAGTGGMIDGTAVQTIDQGGSTTSVTAVPDSNYTFAQWSDGLTTATRSEANVLKSETYTANFDKQIVYYVDIDFTNGSNANLVAVDKMGRATVTLDGFTGTTTSGYNGKGLSNADGTGVALISGVDLSAIDDTVEIGLEFTDVLQNSTNHRGRILKSVGVSDIYHTYASDTSALTITCETSSSNGGRLYGDAGYDLSNEEIIVRLNADKTCRRLVWGVSVNGEKNPVHASTLTDMVDYTIKDISGYIGNLANATQYCVLNRESKDRPFCATLKRFYIRSYNQ